MRIGLVVPHVGRSLSTSRLVDFCGEAESLGVDVIWFGDHIAFPYGFESPYPYGTRDGFDSHDPQELWDALSVMAFVAGVTKTIALATGVLILPYRHPILTAKAIATIDVLSGGRVMFGAGVGWLKEEFEALDAPEFSARGAVADEQLEIIRAVWTDERPTYVGTFYKFGEVSVTPKPTQRPHPPILVGGNSRPAMRRAVRFGDYWHSAMLLPDELSSSMARLKDTAEAEGRTRPLRVSMLILIHLTRDRGAVAAQSHDERRKVITGTPEQVVETLQTYREAGVELLQTSITHDGSFGRADDGLGFFMKEMWPTLGTTING